MIMALRNAIVLARAKCPFRIDAWVLPPDDANFSTRWSFIKRQVSMSCHEANRRQEWITYIKQKHRKSTLYSTFHRYLEQRIYI